jgi:hypothetical protein
MKQKKEFILKLFNIEPFALCVFYHYYLSLVEQDR